MHIDRIFWKFSPINCDQLVNGGGKVGYLSSENETILRINMINPKKLDAEYTLVPEDPPLFDTPPALTEPADDRETLLLSLDPASNGVNLLGNGNARNRYFMPARVQSGQTYAFSISCSVSNSRIQGTSHVGGLVGRMMNYAFVTSVFSIENSYVSSSTVTGNEGWAGGLIGSLGHGNPMAVFTDY